MKKTLFFATITFALTAHAQDFSIRDYCQATPQEREVADATAMMLPNGFVTDNGDGTYSITSSPFSVPQLPPPGNICPDEPLYNQPQAAQGRTAFLVDADRMVTAPHDVPPNGMTPGFDPHDYTIVFGLRLDRLSQGGCGTIDPAHVPEENVYRLDEDAGLYSSFDTNPLHPSDYLYFKLPRPGPKVKPLALRRSGAPDIGDPLLIVGHPDHILPAKVDVGASVKAVTPAGLIIGHALPIRGSSGSPVYNLRKRVVETVIAQADIDVEWVWDAPRMCNRLRPEIDLLRSSNINNGPLAPFVSHVDPSPREIQVSPLTTVRHERLPNGEITNATSSFTIAPSPLAGPTPETFKIITSQNSLEAATWVQAGPAGNAIYSATLSPGDPPKTIDVVASATPGTCGVHENDIRVLRSDNQTERVITHRFELGMSDFTVTPNGAWSVSKLQPAFPTRTITVSNRGPIAATYNVTSTKTWLTINGNASASLNLAAVGASVSTAAFTLGFAANAESTVALGGTETALVTVAPANADCSLRPAESFPITFTNGIQTFDGTAGSVEPLPAPTGGNTFGSVVEIPVDLSGESQFTVADVNLDIGFFNDSGARTAEQVDIYLRAALVAPDGTTAVLWDRNNGTSGYFANGSPEDNTADLTLLRLDDATKPPLGQQLLATFNGRIGNGVWKLRLQGAAGVGIAYPWLARLVIKKAATGAPMAFSSINANFDPTPAPAPGQTFGAPLEFPFDLNGVAPFTVGDVNLDVNLYPDSPYYGVVFADTMIKLELVAPDLTTALLWNRNDSTMAYQLGQVIFHPFDGIPLTTSVLSLDDTGKPPLGGNLLSTFNGHAGKGTWKLRIYGSVDPWNIVPMMATLYVTPAP